MSADPAPEPVGPLDMARNLVAGIQRAAGDIRRDAPGAYVAGQYGHAAAQLAGNLALVSIAEDLRRIAEILAAQRYKP